MPLKERQANIHFLFSLGGKGLILIIANWNHILQKCRSENRVLLQKTFKVEEYLPKLPVWRFQDHRLKLHYM